MATGIRFCECGVSECAYEQVEISSEDALLVLTGGLKVLSANCPFGLPPGADIVLVREGWYTLFNLPINALPEEFQKLGGKLGKREQAILARRSEETRMKLVYPLLVQAKRLGADHAQLTELGKRLIVQLMFPDLFDHLDSLEDVRASFRVPAHYHGFPNELDGFVKLHE